LKIYLVGGAVRDQLLNRPVLERDWVVVGATPKEMLSQGFQQVGKDFPVFLHPQSKEEYALARTERKVGRGYKGFECDAAPSVSLEDDLKRRDLTINAIAQDEMGNLIDPYGGQQDLANKRLRHVSLAFAEDPLRILRVARFAARFPDFSIDQETLKLMRQMVEAGEVNELVPERVWQEIIKTLKEKSTQRFFEVLKECGAEAILFPEFSLAELDFISADHAASQTENLTIRFAALFHRLSLIQINQLCKHYRIPSIFCELLILVSEGFANFQHVETFNAEELLNLFEKTDAMRRPERFENFLFTAVFIDRQKNARKKMAFLMELLASLKNLDIRPLTERHSGLELAGKIREARLKKITEKLAYSDLN
jgi:tRNA nucleotidyltransferase (CCA-adding enzyme)